MELDYIRTFFEREMQLMQSHHADLTSDQWTFEAVSFKASAGDHLIISKREWEQLWRALKTAKSYERAESTQQYGPCSVCGGTTAHKPQCTAVSATCSGEQK